MNFRTNGTGVVFPTVAKQKRNVTFPRSSYGWLPKSLCVSVNFCYRSDTMSMTVIKTVTILELIRFRSSTGDTGLLISSGDSLSVTVTSLIRTCRGGFCPRRRRHRRGKKNKCRLPRLAEDTGSARVVFRWLEGSVWRRFHKKISMRRTVSIRWKFRLHVNGSGAHDAGRHTARLLSFNMNTLKVPRTCIHSLCPHATDLLHHNHQLEPQHRNFDG
jgi:hypothetical protein